MTLVVVVVAARSGRGCDDCW